MRHFLYRNSHTHLMVLSGLLLLWAGSAFAETHAATPEDGEDLVMRLTFEDCLGFVLEGREPFQGLDTQPISETAADSLPSSALGLGNSLQIINERYHAVWGEDAHVRACVIRVDLNSDAPMRLLVDPDGFLERVTERAATYGLTQALTGETFDPLTTNSWSEPGEDEHELRMSVNAITPSKDGEQMDVMISVSAGVGG